MDKVLRPERLGTDPNSSDASSEWTHWKCTFENFLGTLTDPKLNKLSVLTNFVSPRNFQYIESCATYEEAIKALESIFKKPVNEIYARHKLATRRQQPNETIDDFLRALQSLSKSCNFKSVTAVESRDEYIRDAFITGLQSSTIRQRLLENKTLSLNTMFDQARALDSAVQNSQSYGMDTPTYNAAGISSTPDPTLPDCSMCPKNDCHKHAFSPEQLAATSPINASKCFFCGNKRHFRSRCPAKEATCSNCHKKGHYARVCRSSPSTTSSSLVTKAELASTTAGVPKCLDKSTAVVSVNGVEFRALFDSGSSESYIHPRVVSLTKIQEFPSSGAVSMAMSSFSTNIRGCCVIDLMYHGRNYDGLKVNVLPDLCADLILGIDFQSRHSRVTFKYGGPEPPLSVCGLSTLNMQPPSPFLHLTPDCHPVATKSRRYSKEDSDFIAKEVERLLKEGIIEPSNSPWRAQVVVTKGGNHKKRLVIDYSQTINRFTLLDAFPLPNINDQINEIAQYNVFSTIDLQSAYHQVPLRAEDRPYTAFEANSNLLQFTRLPFGVTNGVACFQREMINFVRDENLKAVFPYLDNITICGKNQEEHDANLKAFLDAAKRKNITYNESKSVFSTKRLPILGYVIENSEIRPDPDRLKPLREMPIPHDSRSLKRCLGMFSYYSKWIPFYSDKLKVLLNCKSFPLSQDAIDAFHGMKKMLEAAVVRAIDDKLPFVVETDASDYALAATLSQDGRPVAFFSRCLQGSELRYPSIEKEAQAIIEAIRRWRHLLTNRHFLLKTDQKSVAFMFDRRHRGKIKNDKILRWRMELSCYSFDIIHQPGRENIAADTLSRSACACATTNPL